MGLTEGELDGYSVELMLDGDTEGLAVGTSDDVILGCAVGILVGRDDGVAEGSNEMEGTDVGTELG